MRARQVIHQGAAHEDSDTPLSPPFVHIPGHFYFYTGFRRTGERKEAEDIKKGWQENTEELYKKDLYDPNNHDGVITHLEPDILE